MFSRSLIVLSTALTLALANPLTARQDGGTAFNVTIVDFHSVFTPGAAGSISCTLDTAANSGAAVVTCNLIVPAGEPIQSDTRDYECPDFKVYQIRCDTVGRLTVGITRFCNECAWLVGS